MATITTWFTLGLVGMVAGTLVLAYGYRMVPESTRQRYLLLVAIPGIAIFGYAAMALNIGTLQVQGHEVYVPRYVDWLLTTPLNIAFLGLLAEADRRPLGAMIGLQAGTILFGFIGAVLAPPVSWVAFLLGSVAFAGVIYLLFVQVDTAARETLSESGQGLFQTLRNFVVVLWLVYPVIWILEPAGFGVMDIETASLVVAYLDVVTKVGFGLIALHGHVIILDVDEDPGSVPPADEGDDGDDPDGGAEEARGTDEQAPADPGDDAGESTDGSDPTEEWFDEDAGGDGSGPLEEDPTAG